MCQERLSRLKSKQTKKTKTKQKTSRHVPQGTMKLEHVPAVRQCPSVGKNNWDDVKFTLSWKTHQRCNLFTVPHEIFITAKNQSSIFKRKTHVRKTRLKVLHFLELFIVFTTFLVTSINCKDLSFSNNILENCVLFLWPKKIMKSKEKITLLKYLLRRLFKSLNANTRKNC